MEIKESETAQILETAELELPYTEKQIAIASKARDHFVAGYHCSEAIMKVFNEEYQLKYPASVIRMATGLGGGLGKAKCCCGAVTTGALILSSIYGRSDLHGDDSLAFDLARELHDRFKKQFRTTCCVALTRKIDWGHPNHTQVCAEYVYGAALILSEMIDRSLHDLGDAHGLTKRLAEKKPAAKRTLNRKAEA